MREGYSTAANAFAARAAVWADEAAEASGRSRHASAAWWRARSAAAFRADGKAEAREAEAEAFAEAADAAIAEAEAIAAVASLYERAARAWYYAEDLADLASVEARRWLKAAKRHAFAVRADAPDAGQLAVQADCLDLAAVEAEVKATAARLKAAELRREAVGLALSMSVGVDGASIVAAVIAD